MWTFLHELENRLFRKMVPGNDNGIKESLLSEASHPLFQTMPKVTQHHFEVCLLEKVNLEFKYPVYKRGSLSLWASSNSLPPFYRCYL
jgi:hypothetical protein